MVLRRQDTTSNLCLSMMPNICFLTSCARFSVLKVMCNVYTVYVRGGSTLKKVKKVKLINVKFQNSGLESLTFLT